VISFFKGRQRSLGGQTSEIYAKLWVDFREYLHHFKGARLAVFLCIALHANEDGWAFPSYELLIKETGYSGDTIRRALADLCALEINGHRVLLRYQAQVEEGKQFDSNRYLIFPDAAEVEEYEGIGVYHKGAESGGGFGEEPSLENPTTAHRGGVLRPGRGGKTPPLSRTKGSRTSTASAFTEEAAAALELLLSLPRMDPAIAEKRVTDCNLADIPGWVEEGHKADPEVAAALVIARLRDRIPPPINGPQQEETGFEATKRKYAVPGVEW